MRRTPLAHLPANPGEFRLSPRSMTGCLVAGTRRVRTAQIGIPRRGAAIVYVLIVLLAVSMMGLSLARGTIAQHRQRRRDEARAQTVRLMEAGWNRALRQWALQPDYTGEVWELTAENSQLSHPGLVTIHLERNGETANISVTAEYPRGETFVNRVTQTGELKAAP